MIARTRALPTASRRRREYLRSKLHRIRVERKAVITRILLKRADRLKVERPRRPALIHDQIAAEHRDDWWFDPATRLTHLTFDATQRLRGSIRQAIKEKFGIRRSRARTRVDTASSSSRYDRLNG
jgi:hypothetical protein